MSLAWAGGRTVLKTHTRPQADTGTARSSTGVAQSALAELRGPGPQATASAPSAPPSCSPAGLRGAIQCGRRNEGRPVPADTDGTETVAQGPGGPRAPLFPVTTLAHTPKHLNQHCVDLGTRCPLGPTSTTPHPPRLHTWPPGTPSPPSREGPETSGTPPMGQQGTQSEGHGSQTQSWARGQRLGWTRAEHGPLLPQQTAEELEHPSPGAIPAPPPTPTPVGGSPVPGQCWVDG